MASLSSLPVELISRIGELTDPFSHLDLACTSSFIAASMKDILKRHRAEYAKMPCSDLNPLMIPRLLRDVIADPVAAHHLQTINIWCIRSNWSEWRPFQLQAPPGPHEDFFEKDSTPAAWSLRPGEVEMYLDLLSKHLANCEEGSEFREMARNELAKGDDGLLKALLILLCPRLRTVNFARTSYVDTEQPMDVGNTCLAWLCRVAVSHRDQDIKLWPPGLQSLRNLAIGVETGTVFDGDIRHVYDPLVMAKILNLPNVESLYLYGIGYGGEFPEDDDNVERFPLTPGSSFVRYLYMDHLENIEMGFWRAVAGACKNQLISVAFHGETHDIDDYIGSTIKEALNLQSIVCYGSGLTGYRCGLFYPQETLRDSNLRVVTVDMSDLALEAQCKAETFAQDFMGYLAGAPPEEPALPTTLEVLVLKEDFDFLANEMGGDSRLEDAAECFDEALAAMISSTHADRRRKERIMERESAHTEQRSDLDDGSQHHSDGEEEGALPSEQVVDDEKQQSENEEGEKEEDEEEEGVEESGDDDDDSYIFNDLKAIYIEPWGGRNPPAAMQSSSKLWLQKSIQAGIERGVDVRTRTNVNKPMHRDLRFHTAPDQFDLRPDIAAPESCDFDPLQGKWIDRGCWNCGDCEECFAMFPKELWAQAYRAPKEAAEKDGENEETEQGGEDGENVEKKDAGGDGEAAEDEADMSSEYDVRYGTCDEIWTRISVEIEPNYRQMGYRIQQLEDYRKDRRCAGEDDYSGRQCVLPPLVFPETARTRATSAKTKS